MKSAILIALLLALAGCGNKTVPPSWKANASSSLEAYGDAYMKGDTGIADLEFTRARNEMASTGRPDLVAKAELYRCAVRVASLDFDGCPGFDALAQDAKPEERAYADYLAGRLDSVNASLLPEQHRAIVTGKGGLAAIADPLSRLVAAGVLMRANRIAPADIALATDAASNQGWRRPLLVWLGVALKRAQAAGDSGEAARIRRRIDLASKP
jgi:predicted small lipoprotein YifL